MTGHARGRASLKAVRRAAVAVSCAVAVLAGHAALAQDNQFKRIRDVSVSCTEGLRCDLQTYNARAPLYTVIFRRSAGPEAPVSLVLGVRETLDAGSDVTFYIDGRQVLSLPVSDLHYRAAVYEYNYTSSDEIDALIEAAMAGDELRVAYRPRGPGTVSTFSLAGFGAGLGFMDEVQARVGQPDALAATAPATFGGDGMVTDIDAIGDIPFQIRSEFRAGGSAACGGLDDAGLAELDGFEAGSGGDLRLIGLPCGAGEPPNQAYAFWEQTGSTFRRIALPVMSEEGPTTADTAWNASWDQENQSLTGYYKASETGDCGTFNRWVWKERDGRNVFILRESRKQDECGGTVAGGPEDWPLVWPAQG